MLPTALMLELYDQEISSEDFERMLIVPEGSDGTYDPYKPIKQFSSLTIETSPKNNGGKINSGIFADDDTYSSSSSTMSASPRGENVSYWQDLEVYSSSSDEESRPLSSLSWTSMDEKKTFFKNNSKPILGRSRSYDVKGKYCSFCFHNREKENVYTSHALRDDANNITCPALFEVVCRYCGATGTEAHTPKYCPNRTFNMS